MGIKVYKVGGNVVENEDSLLRFCRQFASIEGPKVLIHGGGVMASAIQKELGQHPIKIEGRRVTDEETLKVVTMVYSGWCNKHITALLQAHGCNAIGLSGCDANVITASRRAPKLLMDGITTVDYGFVGDVSSASVNVEFLTELLDLGITPVLCAINHDGKGQLLNTNADTVASSVAAALKATLYCCFELNGVLKDINDPDSIIPTIYEDDFQNMKSDGTISEGMIPKIENCLKTVKDGAVSAIIRSADLESDCNGTEIKICKN